MENVKNLIGQFISDTWWLVLLRGIMLLLFGILFLLQPGMTLIMVMAILGAFWFVDGIFMIINSIVGHRYIKGWGWGIFSGILGVFAGIIVMLHPVAGAVFSQLFLVYFVGIIAIFKGVSEIYFGIILRKEIKNEWTYILVGLISIVFGTLILMNPVSGIMMLIWMVIFLSIVGGILLIVRSFQLHKIGKELTEKKAG
jgi:uncharacterized membrane protein HdeD (DUF308 family)